jgi:signal transduction histidine kinase
MRPRSLTFGFAPNEECCYSPQRIASPTSTFVMRTATRGMEIFSPRGNGEPILGIGISGMRERVRQLEGEFLISNSLGIGTTIQVCYR